VKRLECWGDNQNFKCLANEYDENDATKSRKLWLREVTAASTKCYSVSELKAGIKITDVQVDIYDEEAKSIWNESPVAISEIAGDVTISNIVSSIDTIGTDNAPDSYTMKFSEIAGDISVSNLNFKPSALGWSDYIDLTTSASLTNIELAPVSIKHLGTATTTLSGDLNVDNNNYVYISNLLVF
jgi:hypothetical protein